MDIDFQAFCWLTRQGPVALVAAVAAAADPASGRYRIEIPVSFRDLRTTIDVLKRVGDGINQDDKELIVEAFQDEEYEGAIWIIRSDNDDSYTLQDERSGYFLAYDKNRVRSTLQGTRLHMRPEPDKSYFRFYGAEYMDASLSVISPLQGGNHLAIHADYPSQSQIHELTFRYYHETIKGCEWWFQPVQ
ncbi:hypothetical protein BGX23_009274 [Mortierella sp. AD031]|nr:hypothetical protein BGX23_009274 [Mortierella sp. AD031]